MTSPSGTIEQLAVPARVPSRAWRAHLVILTVVVAGFYLGTLDNGFHLDDFRNFAMVDALHLEHFSLATLRDALPQAILPQRVLPNATLIFDWWRGGGATEPFQQTNLLIHILSSIAVYWFVVTILAIDDSTRDAPAWRSAIALFAAAAWALHPIQVQAVTYVVQRMASMVALFFIVSVIAYVQGRLSHSLARRLGWFSLALLAGYCAMLSKENALMLPPVLLLAEYGLCRSGGPQFRHWIDRYLWLAVVLVAVYILLDLFVLEGPVRVKMNFAYIYRDFTMEERILTQPRVILFHLGQMLWPLPERFSLEHDFEISRGLLSPPSTLAAMLFIAAWLAAGLRALFSANQRVIGFLLVFPLVAMIPENTVHGLEMVFEHRMYLPSVGLFAAGAVLVARALRSRRSHVPSAAAAACAVVVALGIATFLRLPEWRDEISLGRANIRNAPTYWRPWMSYGIALQHNGEFDAARDALAHGVSLAGNDRNALEIAAHADSEMGYLGDAIGLLRRLQDLNENTPYVRQQRLLGRLLIRCGDFDGARHALHIAQTSAPWDTETLDMLKQLDSMPSAGPADQACRPAAR